MPIEELHFLTTFFRMQSILLASLSDTVQTLVPVLLVHKTAAETSVESETLSSSIRTFDLVHHVLVPVMFGANFVE